ncbi:atp-dependent RNA helicase a protein [Rutstroemia sp. NJR-2017a BVV2]|nr:atp-dependent RNA helicase a protein [Rutstroemia sp. NJR-2017a BVV2]
MTFSAFSEHDCHVTLSLRERSLPIEVSAVGPKKATAQDVAMLKLLLQLDEEQLLERVLVMLRKVQTTLPDQQEPQAQHSIIPDASVCMTSTSSPSADIMQISNTIETPLSQSQQVSTDVSNSLKCLAPPAASEEITKTSSSTAAVPPNSLEHPENGTVTGDTAGSLLSAVSSDPAGNVPETPPSQSQAIIQLSGHNVVQLLDSEGAYRERNVIFDVYSLAAMLSLDVEHKFEVVQDTGGADETYRIEINLRDHDLKIVATGHNPRKVESSAFLAFKQQARIKGILDKAPVSPLLQHPVVLSTSVASNFMDFYKDHYNPKLRFTLRTYDDKFYQARFHSEPHRFEFDQPFRKVEAHNLESLISLTTASRLLKKQPELWEDYIAKLEPLSHRYVAKARPVALNLTQSSLRLMRQAIEAAQDAGLASPLPLEQHIQEYIPINMRPLTREALNRRSMELVRWYHERLQSRRGQKLDLPMLDYKSEVLETIERNTFSFLVGQTGSGKTTQVPQILLDHYIETGRGGSCRVICTREYSALSVRRIAAKSVAKRVANERGQELGEQVGFHVGLGKELPQNGGSIVYCTTGILLNQLIHQPDSLFNTITHILIDEVHERDMLIDFVLISLRQAIRKRIDEGKKVPRISFMSATMDVDEFKSYFTIKDKAGNETRFPILHVPGRMFPIKEFHLEDILKTLYKLYTENQLSLLRSAESIRYLRSEQEFSQQCVSSVNSSHEKDTIATDSNNALVDNKSDPSNGQSIIESDEAQVPINLVSIVIAHIAKTTEGGSILVFLPGLREIEETAEVLKKNWILGINFGNENKYKMFCLHSSLEADQKDVFEPSPEGCRKIVLATNIAETSITIPDIQHVIDTGKHREKDYDQVTRVSSLPCKWISKSSSKQRAGRAGRVQNGNYYALFTQSTCLSVKIQGHEDKIEDFLAGALEPPAPQAVKASLQSLKDLGALTPEETVTPLGRILGSLPLHPALGKMIVLGIIFRCLDPMIILGAATSNKNIFVQPHKMMTEADDAKRGFTKRSNSDHIAVLKAFNALRALLPVTKSGPTALMREFAREKFLSMRSFHAIHDAAKKIEDVLVDHGMILDTRSVDLPQAVRQYGGDNWNQNSKDMELVKAVLLSGLYPNVARKLLRGGRYQHPSSGKSTLTFHPSSMNNPKNRPWASGEEYAPELVAFGELRLTARNELTMRDTTEITALMANLFGGAASRDPTETDQIVMDNWLPLRVVVQNGTNDETAVRTVLDFYKTVKKMKEYAFDTFSLGKDPAENEIFDLLVRVLRVLLLKEQDLNRYTQRYEFEFMRSLKSGEPWSTAATSNEKVSAVKPDNEDLGPRIRHEEGNSRFSFKKNA